MFMILKMVVQCPAGDAYAIPLKRMRMVTSLTNQCPSYFKMSFLLNKLCNFRYYCELLMRNYMKGNSYGPF